MAKQRLPADLREFLKLFNASRVEYLLIGGYAVAYYGYPRATGDMDIWVAMTEKNAGKIAQILREFGFNLPNVRPDVFLKPDSIVRFGEPPLRIELITTISGVSFDECFARSTKVMLDGLRVRVISREDLLKNKAASGMRTIRQRYVKVKPSANPNPGIALGFFNARPRAPAICVILNWSSAYRAGRRRPLRQSAFLALWSTRRTEDRQW